MAVTRIRNNQIYDGDIVGYAKINAGSLTGNLFAPTVTINSNVTIVGNLTLAGSGNIATINATNTYVNDPIVVFNNGFASTPSYDIGFLVNRNLYATAPYGSVNSAFVWKESDLAFEGIMTTETGTTTGSINNSGFANLKIGNITANSMTLSTGTFTASNGIVNTPISGSTGYFTTAQATNFSSGNVLITGGSITGLGTLGATTFYAANFSSPNVVVSGGYISALSNVAATTATFTNLASGNAVITGAQTYIGTGGTLIANAYVGTGYFTNLSTPNLSVTSESVGTLVATNFSTANAVITGGYVTGLANATATYGTFTNLWSGNITGNFNQGSLNGTVPTANVSLYDSFTASTTNATFYPSFFDKTSGNGAQFTSTTLTYNPSTGLLSATQFAGTGNFTTAYVGNFSSPNVAITGGYASGLANVYATTSQITNFSTANAVITGGSINGTPIGATSATTGKFTTIQGTDTTNATSTSTGALQIAGGASVTKDLWVGGNVYANAIVSTTTAILTVQDSLVYFQAPNFGTGAYLYDQGFYSDMTIGSTYQHTGVVRNHNSNVWTFFSNVASEPSGNTINWSDTGIIYDAVKAGSMTLANSTASTSTSTGALVVTGGAGVGGALYAGSVNTPTMGVTTLYAANFSSPNAVVSGGSINSTPIGATTASTGAFTTLTASGVSTLAGNLVLTAGTDGVSTTTGALVITGDGGLAVGGNINAGTFNHSIHNIKGNLLLGQGNATDSADTILTINVNTDTPLVSNSLVHVSGYNNKLTVLDLDSFASATGFLGRRADGTSTSPTAAQNGEYLTAFGGKGYGQTGYSSANVLAVSGMRIVAAENFTDSSQATQMELAVTPSGSTTAITALRIASSGNVVATATTTSSSTTTGALVVPNGGVGIGGALNVGGTSSHTGAATFSSTITGAGNVVLTSGAVTNNVTTGALVITGTGGAAVGGNINVAGQMFVGSASQASIIAQNALIAARGTSGTGAGTQYTQISAINATNTGSTDFIAYGNDSTSDLMHGFADIGFTGDAFNDPAYTITGKNDAYVFGSGANATVGGNLVLATDYSGAYNDIVIGVGSFYANSEVARFHGNVSNSGYFQVELPTNNTLTANTGAFRVWGGTSLSGNVYHGGATILNGSKTAGYDTFIKGASDDTLIWARPSATYDQVLIGNSATVSTLVRGAKLQINSTDSMLLPTGTTAQRPSNTGGSDVTGMFRYNTTLGYIEFYNGTSWQGVSTQFTVITDEQYNGDNTTTAFTMGASSTTAATIVSINGVVQIPTLAYSVSGTTLTFTEAPKTGDVIDVRRLTTTQSVTAISSTNGYMGFTADNNGAYVTTGTGSASYTTYWEPNGAQVSNNGNVSVASANTATTVDSFSTGTYRSAKYVIQVTNGAKYQVMEALVISDGTTATITTYGTLQTNGNLGVLSATQSGSTALVQFIAANATNNVRVKKDYLTI